MRSPDRAPPTADTSTQFRSLQYLRGLAALLVVYFHAVLQLGINADGATIFPVFGSSGVDIFFVLSGFVMWVSNPFGRVETTIGFYKRRILRVVPLYWAVTLFAIVSAALAPSLARSIRLSVDHIAATFLFVPWPNPAFPFESPNHLTPLIVPGWTLNYEMFFYALFGLVLPFAPKARVALLIAAFAVLIACRFAIVDPPAFLVFYGSGYLLEFLLGIVVAVVALRGRIDRRLAVIALLGGAGWLLATDIAGDERWTAIARGLPAALIVYGAVALERSREVAGFELPRLLGDASYSIYLSHGFAIAALRAVWRAAGLGFGPPAQLAFVIACLVLGSALGIAVYRFVERPLQRSGRRWFA